MFLWCMYLSLFSLGLRLLNTEQWTPLVLFLEWTWGELTVVSGIGHGILWTRPLRRFSYSTNWDCFSMHFQQHWTYIFNSNHNALKIITVLWFSSYCVLLRKYGTDLMFFTIWNILHVFYKSLDALSPPWGGGGDAPRELEARIGSEVQNHPSILIPHWCGEGEASFQTGAGSAWCAANLHPPPPPPPGKRFNFVGRDQGRCSSNGCRVTQMVVCWFAVRKAPVHISAPHGGSAHRACSCEDMETDLRVCYVWMIS